MRPARIGHVALLLALGLTLAFPRIAGADRAAADFFAQRGDAALRDRKWADAQVQYRKALEAEDAHVPARVGLGEALLCAGDRAGAVEAWKRVADGAAIPAPAPPGWVDGVQRAKRRLVEIEVAAQALARIVDKRADDLVAFAGRWASKDADVARAALRDALALRPGNDKARELAASAPELASPPVGDWTPLFDGRSLRGWENPLQTVWSAGGGVMVGDVRGLTCQIRSIAAFSGDFDVRVEARIVEKHGEKYMFAFECAMEGEWKKAVIGVMTDQFVEIEQDGESRSLQKFPVSRPFGDMPTPLDPMQWTTYEARFRGKQLLLFVDGVLVDTLERAPGRDGGNIGLVVENLKAEIRKVEVLKR